MSAVLERDATVDGTERACRRVRADCDAAVDGVRLGERRVVIGVNRPVDGCDIAARLSRGNVNRTVDRVRAVFATCRDIGVCFLLLVITRVDAPGEDAERGCQERLYERSQVESIRAGGSQLAVGKRLR
jgi:hypothetical protein